MCVCVISCPYFEFCNYVYMRVKPPFLVRRMPALFKRYSGCRSLGPYFECCNYVYMRVKPPFLVRRMPALFKRYSGCRSLVRRMPLVEQTRFGCLEYKSKNKCCIGLNSSNHLLTYTVFNRNCFVNITVHANIRIYTGCRV